MSFGEFGILEHLEALRKMLWHILLAVSFLLFPAFYLTPPLIDELVRHTLPNNLQLNYFTPFEPLMIQMKLALYLALAGALPVTIRELAIFVGPALYEKEKRWAYGLGAAALILFFFGAAFGYHFILPMVMQFSLAIAGNSLHPVIGIAGFLELCGWLLFGFGLSFQLPLAVFAAVKFGLVRCRTLAKARPVVLVGILLLAAILTPPDVVSQLMLGVPCYLLFELALLLARLVEPPENPELLPIAAPPAPNPGMENPIPSSPAPDSSENEPIERESHEELDDPFPTPLRGDPFRKRRIRYIGGRSRRK